jgi:molybdopterin molybdotransferase
MKTFVSFNEALDLTLSNVPVGESEILPLEQLTGKVLSEDIFSKVDCPSTNTSRKDGYAVNSSDLIEASERNPIGLRLVGRLVAGDTRKLTISSGEALRITTGSPLPEGADAVISEEFCDRRGDTILAHQTAGTGRNILAKGTDIRSGEAVAQKGEKLSPALIGLLAAAGLDKAPVYKSPTVAVIATGDEVIMPGNPLPAGKLYASNMVELCAWLSHYGLKYRAELVADCKEDILAAIARQLPFTDVFLTSGGAWGSERDLILTVAQCLQWTGIYHRVRMGPGKPMAFGLLEKKPFFVLPGGPPSNEMAFLQFALPALLKINGEPLPTFPRVQAQLSETVQGHKNWTDFIHARLAKKDGRLIVYPAKLRSRLQSMARKEALIMIPADRDELIAGDIIDIQVLAPQTYIC